MFGQWRHILEHKVSHYIQVEQSAILQLVFKLYLSHCSASLYLSNLYPAKARWEVTTPSRKRPLLQRSVLWDWTASSSCFLV